MGGIAEALINERSCSLVTSEHLIHFRPPTFSFALGLCFHLGMKMVGNGRKRYHYFIIFSKTNGNGRKISIFMNSSI